jgi:hypothetical protein
VAPCGPRALHLKSSRPRPAPIPLPSSLAPSFHLENPSGRTSHRNSPSPPPPRSDAGEPPPSDCSRTVLRHLPLSSEQASATPCLRKCGSFKRFPPARAVDGAVELALRPPAFSLLLSSFERHHHVRFFTAVLVRTVPRPFATEDGRWLLAAAALPRAQTPAWRGHGRSRPLLDRPRPGPKPRAGPARLFPACAAPAESGRGPDVLTGRPSDMKRIVFSFSFII